MAEQKNSKLYSYQDCWEYTKALLNEKNERVNDSEMRKNLILLTTSSPAVFWRDFQTPLLAPTDFAILCKKLEKHFKFDYPVPYITGKVDFFNLSLGVREGVFIPQSDTECLVRVVLELFQKAENDKAAFSKDQKIKVLDVGTGSGNIAIALAKNRPRWQVVAVDINDSALELTKKNSLAVGVKVKVIKSDLFERIKPGEIFDVIVSNPPYLSGKTWNNLPRATQMQPLSALIPPPPRDQLFYYTEMVRQAPCFLKKGGVLIVEIDPPLKKRLQKTLLAITSKIDKIEVSDDCREQPRVMVIYFKKEFEE